MGATLNAAELPPALTTAQVAELLGVSRVTVWAAQRDEGGLRVGGDIVRPVYVGRAIRWPTAPIMRALGIRNGDDGDG